ncbi:hypothetical protein KAI52_04060, partial [Candidatus Parcubacteria bacterium]|nr:hypothetical protein [Candidatus Parcubacteria bacterium]
AIEICGDGIDNNCDGEVNEDWPNLGEICEVGIGACKEFGIYICDPDDLLGPSICSATPATPSDEICDNIDNDCDGTVDEGCYTDCGDDDCEVGEDCCVCEVDCPCPAETFCQSDGVCISNFILEDFSDTVNKDAANTTAEWAGDGEVRMGITPFVSPVIAQSAALDSTTDDITKATLTVNQNLNGQAITHYLSVNGGADWELVILGTEHTFANTGSDLRWRAVLEAADSSITPTIDGYNLVYELDNGCGGTIDCGDCDTANNEVCVDGHCIPCGGIDNIKSVDAAGFITCRDDSNAPVNATAVSLSTHGYHCMSGTFDWRCEGVGMNASLNCPVSPCQLDQASCNCVCFESAGENITYKGYNFGIDSQCCCGASGESGAPVDFCTW